MDGAALAQIVSHAPWDCVINAAAYTAVGTLQAKWLDSNGKTVAKTTPSSAYVRLAGDLGTQVATQARQLAERHRLVTVATAVMDQLRAGGTRSLRALMGSDLDARKLVSSMTLFGHVARKLHEADGLDAYNSMATLADTVLAEAARQGYPPCAYTLGRLRPAT